MCFVSHLHVLHQHIYNMHAFYQPKSLLFIHIYPFFRIMLQHLSMPSFHPRISIFLSSHIHTMLGIMMLQHLSIFSFTSTYPCVLSSCIHDIHAFHPHPQGDAANIDVSSWRAHTTVATAPSGDGVRDDALISWFWRLVGDLQEEERGLLLR